MREATSSRLIRSLTVTGVATILVLSGAYAFPALSACLLAGDLPRSFINLGIVLCCLVAVLALLATLLRASLRTAAESFTRVFLRLLRTGLFLVAMAAIPALLCGGVAALTYGLISPGFSAQFVKQIVVLLTTFFALLFAPLILNALIVRGLSNTSLIKALQPGLERYGALLGILVASFVAGSFLVFAAAALAFDVSSTTVLATTTTTTTAAPPFGSALFIRAAHLLLLIALATIATWLCVRIVIRIPPSMSRRDAARFGRILTKGTASLVSFLMLVSFFPVREALAFDYSVFVPEGGWQTDVLAQPVERSISYWGEYAALEGSGEASDALSEAPESSLTASLGQPAFASDGVVLEPPLPAAQGDGKADPPTEPGAVEIARTSTTRTFENEDGSFTTRFYADPLRYVDASGQERDIDNTLIAAENGGYTNTANSFAVTLPEEGSSFSIEGKDYTISVTPAFGDLGHAVIADNAIRYNEIAPGLDLQYTVLGGALKEDLIIARPLESYDFSYTLTAPGITFVQDGDLISGFRSEGLPLGFIDLLTPPEEVRPVFTLSAPVMYDADGARSQAISLALGEETSTHSDQVTLTVSPDASWINDVARVFPVIVDPSYQLTPDDIVYGTVQAREGYHSGPDVSHEGNPYLYVGLEDGSLINVSPISYGQSWAYLKINDIESFVETNFADIPEDAIFTAVLYAWCYKGTGANPLISAKMIAQPWQRPMTWNSRPINLTDLANAQSAAVDNWLTFDISEAFVSWLEDPSTNNGIMLVPNDESQPAVAISGPNNSHGAQQLYFELSWTVPNAADEEMELAPPNVNLRPLTAKEPTLGLQLVTGLFADGLVRPQLSVDYVLQDADTDVPVVSDLTEMTAEGTYEAAEWGRIYPDSDPIKGIVPFTLGYRNRSESNWQTAVFLSSLFDDNVRYEISAQASGPPGTTEVGTSDSFIIYRFSATDTLPSIAAYYGVSLEQLIKDNRPSDNLAFPGNTFFIRNPNSRGETPYARAEDPSIAEKRSIIYASMGRNMHSEYSLEPVDMASGNFYLEVTDAASGDYTSEFQLTRSYNSRAPKYPGLLGLGWSFAFGETLAQNAEGGLSYHRGDGKILEFLPDGQDGYISPAGYNLTLSLNRPIPVPEVNGEEEPDYNEIAAALAATTYVICDRDGATRTFNSFGQLSSITDTHGATSTIGYDEAQVISSVTTPAGRIYTLETNDAGQIARITQPNGGQIIFDYAQDCLVSVTNADGDVVRYGYDEAGLMSAWYDGAGNRVVANDYDEAGRVISQIDALGACSTLVYEDDVTIKTDPDGEVTTYGVDGQLRISGIQGADAPDVRQYDAANQLISRIDETGSEVSYSYDSEGRIAKTTRPDGSYQELSYDNAGHVLSVRDFNGNVTVNTYSDSGDLIRVDYPDGSSVTFTYDSCGRMTSATDGNGDATTLFWDGIASLVVSDALGNETVTHYDVMGRRISQVDATGFTQKWSYTPAGKLSSIWASGGFTETYFYDAAGNCVEIRDANGEQSVFNYDAANRMIAATNPLGATTAWTYDATGNKATETDALGNTTSYAYDAAGNLIEEIDALGATWAYEWDDYGHLLATRDASDHTTTYSWDETSGLLVREEGPTGIVNYGYDGCGNLISCINADGTREEWTFDEMGRMVGYTAPSGLVSSYVWDAAGRLLSESDSEGATTSYTWDAAGNLLEETDALGNTTRYAYDKAGRLSEMVRADGAAFHYVYTEAGELSSIAYPDGSIESYSYDKSGNLLVSSDREKHATTYTYDALGDLIGVSDALGNTTHYAYDAAQRLVSTTSPRGAVTSYEYDACGRPVTITDAEGASSTIAYDAMGNVTSVSGANGGVTRSTYDEAGRIISIRDAEGFVITYSYNDLGQMEAWTDTAGNSLSFTYDEAGRLESQTDALGRLAEYGYDAYGNTVLERSFIGDTTTTTYDALGRVKTQAGNDGREVTYEYDRTGNILSVTDADGRALRYTWDADGYLLSETDALFNTTAYTYDAVGNLLSAIYADGANETFSYDAAYRLASVSDALKNTTRYAWDADGNLTSLTHPDETQQRYTYDLLGRLIEACDEGDFLTTYTWDGLGNVTSITSPSGAVSTFAYDKVGRLITQNDALGNTTTYAYRPDGLLSKKTLANGLAITYAYDAVGRITDIADTAGLSYHRVYDERGNISRETDSLARSVRYEYDPMHRKTLEIAPNGAMTRSVYDERGNLIRAISPSSGIYSCAYDEADQLIEASESLNAPITFAYDKRGRLVASTQGGISTSYEYDAAGNLTQTADGTGARQVIEYDTMGRPIRTTDANGNTTAYGYDTRGNLSSVTSPEGFCETWSYDEEGRLASATDGEGKSTTYTYDLAGRLTSLTDPAGRTAAYAWDAMGNVVSRTVAGATERFEYDLHGDLTASISPSGEVERFEYDAASRLTLATSPSGATVSYDYDELDSLLSKTYSSADAQVSFVYDEGGRRKEMSDETGTSTYTYDAAGRLTGYTNGDGRTLSYVWDDFGRISEVLYDDGQSISYSYDGAGRLIGVDDSLSGQVAYTYDAVGNLSSATRPLGICTTYAYDKDDRLILLTNTQSGRVLSRFEYTYDGANRIATEDATLQGERLQSGYTYDEAGHLIEVAQQKGTGSSIDADADTSVVSYEYDEAGNRTRATDDSSFDVSYTYDSSNRLVSSYDAITGKHQTYTYDADGNLSSRDMGGETWWYAYDAECRLRTVSAGSLLLYAASYDGDGSRSASGSNRQYLTSYTYTSEAQAEDREKANAPPAGEGGDVIGSDGSSDAQGPRPDGALANEETSGQGADASDSAPSAPSDNLQAVFWLGVASSALVLASLSAQVVTAHSQGFLVKAWPLDDANGRTEEGDESPSTSTALPGAAAPGTSAPLPPFGSSAAEGSADARSEGRDGGEGGTAGSGASASAPAGAAAASSSWTEYSSTNGFEEKRYLNDIMMEHVQVAQAYDGDGEAIASYTFGTERLAAGSTEGLEHYLYDGRGSVAQVHDGSSLTDRPSYDAFGVPSEASDGDEAFFAWNGEEYDPQTELYFLRARYYAPEVASFITRDSTLGTTGRIDSQNRYAFGEADPVNNQDPSGHSIGGSTWERQMEEAGGINEIYNFYVASALKDAQNQATAAFNSRIGAAQSASHTSLSAIQSISYVSQSQANSYIDAGAAAALRAGAYYGCTPGTLALEATEAFAKGVQDTKETTNGRIADIQSGKIGQYKDYQAYRAQQAQIAWQASLAALAQAEADAAAAKKSLKQVQAQAPKADLKRPSVAKSYKQKVSTAKDAAAAAAAREAAARTAEAAASAAARDAAQAAKNASKAVSTVRDRAAASAAASRAEAQRASHLERIEQQLADTQSKAVGANSPSVYEAFTVGNMLIGSFLNTSAIKMATGLLYNLRSFPVVGDPYLFVGGGNAALHAKNNILSTNLAKGAAAVKVAGTLLAGLGIVIDVGAGIYQNVQAGADPMKIYTDAYVDFVFDAGGLFLATGAAAAVAPATAGAASIPTYLAVSASYIYLTDTQLVGAKTLEQHVKDALYDYQMNYALEASKYRPPSSIIGIS
jgi:RHS repeat-associated protein